MRWQNSRQTHLNQIEDHKFANNFRNEQIQKQKKYQEMLLEEYIIQKIRNIFMKNFLFQINTIRLNLGGFHFKLQNQNHKFQALTKQKDKFDINTFGKVTRFTDPKKSISYQICITCTQTTSNDCVMGWKRIRQIKDLHSKQYQKDLNILFIIEIKHNIDLTILIKIILKKQSMKSQIEQCELLFEQQQYQELSNEISKMIDEEREQEQELQQKQEHLQEQEKQLEQLKKEEETLNEYYSEQFNHLEQEKQLLQQIENEIQIQKQREIQLQIEQKLAAEQEQIYENQKENFMMLFQQCHEYHQQNQILAQEIEGFKDENDDLTRECQHLEGQSEQQIRYINCLKQLNQKTEEALEKLQVYQEELKQLLHKGKQDQGPKFDPIQFIKSVSNAQQQVDVSNQELNEVEQNLSFIQEIDQIPQIQQSQIEEKQGLSFNYRYLAAITATIVLGVIIKKKLL